MQLVKDDGLKVREKHFRILRRDQQRELLRRGQQYVRRIEFLALALVNGRVAGAGLDADIQPHFGDGLHQVALNIDGKRLQR